MDEEAIIGIAIYLAKDKINKTKKRKNRFWTKEWFKKKKKKKEHIRPT